MLTAVWTIRLRVVYALYARSTFRVCKYPTPTRIWNPHLRLTLATLTTATSNSHHFPPLPLTPLTTSTYTTHHFPYTTHHFHLLHSPLPLTTLTTSICNDFYETATYHFLCWAMELQARLDDLNINLQAQRVALDAEVAPRLVERLDKAIKPRDELGGGALHKVPPAYKSNKRPRTIGSSSQETSPSNAGAVVMPPTPCDSQRLLLKTPPPAPKSPSRAPQSLKPRKPRQKTTSPLRAMASKVTKPSPPRRVGASSTQSSEALVSC